MKLNKKGSVTGFILLLVFIFIGILAFTLLMPIALPFIEEIKNSSASPLAKFLFLGVPIFTIISIIFGTIFVGGNN